MHRLAQGLPPKDARGRDVIYIDGQKLCRRKAPLVVAGGDDKKRKKSQR